LIVLDSSAVIAILQREQEQERFMRMIEAADRCVISAATVFESAIVMNARRGPRGVAILHQLLASSTAEIHPFTDAMVADAIDAYQRFGKGTGAKAQLNMGDCISYALAKSLAAPLLFKGDDFAATDAVPCT